MRYLFLLLLLSGCVSVEKAERVMRAHPTELAKLCADCFPVRESEVIRGDTVVLIDTVSEVISDTIRVNADCPDGTVVTVDCPPNKTVTRVIKSHTTDTIKVRDTAYERVLADERDDYRDKWANMEQSRDMWRKRAIWGWGIIFLCAAVVGLRWYIRNRSISRVGW